MGRPDDPVARLALAEGCSQAISVYSNKPGYFSETQLQKKLRNIATRVNERYKHLTMFGGRKSANMSGNEDIR